MNKEDRKMYGVRNESRGQYMKPDRMWNTVSSCFTEEWRAHRSRKLRLVLRMHYTRISKQQWRKSVFPGIKLLGRSKGYEEKDGAPMILRPAYETLIQFRSTIWKAAAKLLSVWHVYSVGHSHLSRGSQWDAVFSLTKA